MDQRAADQPALTIARHSFSVSPLWVMSAPGAREAARHLGQAQRLVHSYMAL
jgi:hypothetical protein